jgi:hypothetical protein
MREQLASDESDDNLRTLVNLLICVGTMVRHQDLVTLVSQSIVLINNLEVGHEMRGYLIRHFDKLLDYTSEADDGESFSGFNPDGVFTSNPLFSDLLDLFGMVSFSSLAVGSGMLPTELRNFVVSCKKHIKFGNDVDSFVCRVMKLMKHITLTLLSCIKEHSLKPLFESRGWSISEWSTVVGQYLRDHRIRKNNGYPSIAEFEELKRQGAIHPFWARQIEIHEHSTVVDQLLAIGEHLEKTNVSRLASTPSLRIVFTQITRDLRDRKYTLLNDKIGGQYRPQPFTIYQYGKPRCGKSLNVKATFNNFAHVVGIAPNPELSFEYVQGSNFMDGYRPGMQWCNMDDADQAVVKPGDRNWATDMIMLCNNKPTPIEAAKVEDKGTLFANFKAILFTSNQASPNNLAHLINTPAAFWGRIQYKVKVVARKEYANEVGALDPDKIPAGCKDVNTFTIYKAQAVGQDWIFKVIEGGSELNRQQYQAFMVKAFKKYYEEQTALVARLNSDSGICIHCGLSNDDHITPCGVKKEDRKVTESATFAEMVDGKNGPAEVIVHVMNEVGEPRARTWAPAFVAACILLSLDPTGRVFLGLGLLVYTLWLREREARQKFYDWAYLGAKFYFMRGMTIKDSLIVWYLTRGDPFKAVQRIEELRDGAFLQRIKERKDVIVKFAGVVAAGLAAYGIYRMMTRKSKDFILTNELLVRETVRDNTFGATVANWITFSKSADVRSAAVMDSTLEKAKTISAADLAKVIGRRYVAITRGTRTIWGFKYRANVLLVPFHMIIDDKYTPGRQLVMPEGEIEMSFRTVGMRVDCKVPTHRMERIPGRDLMLMWVPAIFPLDEKLEKIFTAPPSSLSQVVSAFDQGQLIIPKNCGETCTVKVVEDGDRPRYVTMPTSGGSQLPMLVYGSCTTGGDCGSILLGFAKNSVVPVGMHVAKTTVNGEFLSAAEELVGSELNFAYDRLSERHAAIASSVIDTAQLKTTGMVQSVAMSEMINEVGSAEPEVYIKPMPPKRSSYLAAERWAGGSMPMEPVGMMVGFHGTKMKTSIKKSSYHKEVSDYFEATYPEVDRSYVLPIFTGKRVAGPEGDDYWLDPHTVNFRSMVNDSGSPALWDQAMADYLLGVEDLEGWHELRPLGMAEVYLGVRGVVKPNNLKTSTGLPFNRPKKHFIKPIDNDSVAVAAAIVRHSEFVRKVWRERKIYAMMCNHSLKDEVIKEAKRDLCKIRTFNTVSEGVNDSLKRVTGPLLAFILKHRDFFECFGGVNITGPDLDAFMARKDAIDPERKRRIAGDYASYDNRQNTEVILRVAFIFERLAELAGFSDDDRAEVFFGVLSCAYTVRVCQGDVVLMTFGNPSGGFVTLAINSMSNSNTLRYAFYARAKLLSIVPPPFRQVCVLATVGDDNDGAVRATFEWFNQRAIAEELRAVGQTYTSSTKSDVLEEYTRFEDVTFLKRSMWFDSKLKRWKAPLDKGSIVRMLLFTKKSEGGVSLCDQESDIVGTALREMYLHGDQAYLDMVAFVEDLMEKRPGMLPKLRILSLSTLDEKFLRGELLDWATVYEVDEVVTTSWCNESGEEAGPPVDLGPVAVLSPSGGMETAGMTSSEVTASSVGDDLSLARFLFRSTQIATGSLTNSDVPTSLISTVYPLLSILSSTALAHKLQNFHLMRGDLEVTFQFNSSSMFKGMYLISAMPIKAGACGRPAAVDSDFVWNAYNGFNGVHVVVDVCSSNTAVLTLPYLSEYNYYNLTTGAGDPGWRVKIFCLDPAINVNNPTNPVVVPWNAYARFIPENFELCVPVNEAKVKKHAIGQTVGKKSGAISNMLGMAKKVTDIVAVLPGAGGLATAVGTGLSVAQSIADVFGFTKEQAEQDPQIMRPGNWSNIATTDGVFNGQMVGLSGGNNVTIDASLGGNGEDDSAFVNLFPRPTMIKRFDWASTAVRQATLASIPVTPGFCATGTGINGLQPTVAGAIGAPFTYWNGSMVYEVMVSCNSLLQGSLQVVWSPSATPPTTNVMDQAWNHIIDISVEKTHVFKVHFATHYPALKMQLASAAIAGDQYQNGFLHFQVATPLVAPSTVGATVVVLAAAAGDMQFSVPQLKSAAGTPFKNGLNFDNQAGMEETETVDLTSVPRNGINLCAVLGGEAVGSVRQLMQKMSMFSTATLAAGGLTGRLKSTINYPFYPPVPGNLNITCVTSDAGGNVSPVFTWLGYYSGFYAGLRGGVRTASVITSPGVANEVYYVAASMNTGTLTAISSCVAQSSLTNTAARALFGLDMPGAVVWSDEVARNGFQFTFPYYDSVKFRSNFLNTDADWTQSVAGKWITYEIGHYNEATPLGGIKSLITYMGGAADITPVYFLAAFPVSLS